MNNRVVWISYDSKGADCARTAHQVGADIVGIVTLPPPERSSVISPGDFESLAAEVNAELILTRRSNSAECVKRVSLLHPDVIFVVGWSQLLSNELIGLASTGVFNIHPTKLPKHRGRAPIPSTILSGLSRTAVTLHEILDERADNGPVVAQVEIAVDELETATTLYEKARQSHIDLVRSWLPLILEGAAPRMPQDEQRSSWWYKREPKDAIIDWDMRANRVDEWIRAHTHPFSGSYTFEGAAKLYVWSAAVGECGAQHTSPGTVTEISSRGPCVQCGTGEITLLDYEFVNATRAEHVLKVGSLLG